MPRQHISLVPALIASFVCVSAACGGDKTAEPAPAAAPTPSAAQPPAPSPKMPATPEGATVVADADGLVQITGNDTMKFSATRIEAKAGKIKIELKNVGTLPREAMSHNLIVLRPGADIAAFGAKAIAAKASDYIPADDADMLGHTKLLGPGESDTLEIELAAGTYPFLCSFPGHYALMRGDLVVE